MAWRQTILTIVIAVSAALFVRQFLLTAYRIPTGSMQPTLKPGDFIFSFRRAYAWFGVETVPARGDVIVFRYPQQPDVNYIKRVIGLPGDRLEMKEHRVILNGRPLEYKIRESSEDSPQPEVFQVMEESDGQRNWGLIVQRQVANQAFGPIVVPPGEVFVMGDNRDTSDDSRYWGTVPVAHISGQAIFIWMSVAKGKIRWERLFQSVH